jgi:hypothetical protein
MRSKLALLLAVAVLAAAAAGVAASSLAWLEPATSAGPLPEKAAIFTDASFLRRGADGRLVLSVAESIKMAAAIDDETESVITSAKWTAALKGKFFIGAYATEPRLTAADEGAEPALKPAPQHLDPTVCRNEKTSAAMIELWRAASRAFVDPSGALPTETARSVGARFQADTLVFIFGISRKDDSAASPGPPDAGAALGRLESSLVAAVIARAADGKVVFHGAAPLTGPQRELTFRGVVRALLKDLPRRGANSLSYPTPTLSAPSKANDAPAAGGAPASPWLDGPAGGGPSNLPPPPDPTAGRPGRLVGPHPVNLLRRPMAIAEPIATAPSGTAVRVLKTDMSWVLVQLPDGVRGWVFGKWVELE